MSMDRVPMTLEGYQKLEAELRDGGEPKAPQKSEPAAPPAAADAPAAAATNAPPKGLSPRQKKTLVEIRDDLRALLKMLSA